MKQLVFVHGSYSRDSGTTTIDTLKPYMRNYEILESDYGFINVLGSIIFNANIAEVIAGMAPENAVGIGHSNGCNLLYKACFFRPKFKVLILINPALNPTITFPEYLSRIIVLHNKYDYGVGTSRLFNKNWGAMGNVGYKGNDARVENYETNELFDVKGHKGIFDKAQALAKFIDNKIGLKYYCQACGHFNYD